LVWIIVGVTIGILSWGPINLADPRDIPFIPAILAFIGTGIGGIIVLVVGIRWVRHDCGINNFNFRYSSIAKFIYCHNSFACPYTRLVN